MRSCTRLLWLSMALTPVPTLLVAPLAAQTTVDTLATPQGPVSSTGAPAFSSVPSTALGGERDIEVVRLSGSGTVTAQVSGSMLTFATVAGDTGRTVISWDGVDGGSTINPTGLGGQNLTAGGHDALRFTINQGTPGLQLAVEVYSDATHTSAFTFALPQLASPTELILPYDDFIPSQGSMGADFTSVGAIALQIESLGGAGGNLELQGPINTTVAAPVVKAIKDDLEFPGGTALLTATVGPGDTVTYRITITNTGATAVGVELDDLLDSIDNISSGAPLNLRSTPIAVNDRYDHCGNSTLVADGSAPAVEGLLDNDNDPDGDPLTVVAIQSPSDQGGSVTLDDANNGYFTYVPPAGFRGTDTFAYTIEDDDGNQVTATAVISIPSLVWFVDSSHGGSDEGTQANPFQDLTRLNGAVSNLDGPGDVIFVYQGSGPYAGGLPLEDDQKLIGSPAGLTECVATPIPPSGARPVITNVAGVGITLAADNTIDSVNIDGTSGTGLSGASFGTANVASCDVTNAGGAAVDIDNGTMALSFGNLSSAGTGGAPGIDLTNVDGSFAVSGSTSLTNPNGAGVRVQNAATGTTFDFGATTITDNNIGAGPSGTGIDIATGNDATFTFDTLSVTADGGPGLVASSSGTVNINSTGTTINATGGPAVDLASTTGQTNGIGGWTFSSLSSTNSSTDGIRLASLGNSVTVATASISGSVSNGIEISSCSGAIAVNGGTVGSTTNNAVDINGGAANVTISANLTNASGRSVNVVNRSGGTVNIAGSISDTGTGINVASNTGGTTTFSGSSKVINTGTSQAVTVATNSGHTISFTGGGLDIDTTSGNGFSATGGATAVTVEGTGNSITSTTGTALNVDSTTIGANDLTFQSISANGATNGIVLNATGTSGGLIVTGDGVYDRNGSGGTIQNTTSHAIALTNTQDFSLSELNLTSPAAHGINATNIRGSNLYRAGVISGVAGSGMDGIRVTNTSTNLTLLEVNNSLFIGVAHDPGPPVTIRGNDGIFFDMKGTTVARIDVLNSSHFNGFPGDGVQVLADDDTTVTANITNSRFSNDAGYNTGRSRLSLRAADGSLPQTGGGDLTATISNNTIQDTGIQSDDIGIPVGAVGVIDVLGDQYASVDVTISNNTIEDLDEEPAIRVVADDYTQSMRAVIEGNTLNNIPESGALIHIRDYTVAANIWVTNNDFGTGANGIPNDSDDEPVGVEGANFDEDTIRLFVQELVGTVNVKMSGNEMVNSSSSHCIDADSEDSAVLNLTLHGNTMINKGANGEAFDIEADNGGSICLDLNGDNVLANRNTLTSIDHSELHRESDGGTYTIEDLTGGTNAAAVQTFLEARNTFSPTLDVVDEQPFASASNCPEPN